LLRQRSHSPTSDAARRGAGNPPPPSRRSCGHDPTPGLPDYKSIAGNRGAYCLHRAEGDIAHFDMLTLWDDVEAIKRFAGDDYQVAKYDDFDRSFLIELEPYVRHYTVYGE
jgi:hypothetical protein